ncbi:acetyl-/propionyl-CoA carboxylase beta subunit [Nocardia nova SH22a]|uniref:Acetyl-/propionyl-CoA carboxylase beta subunit n=1 Tax=Nocardia nova SH22a TaxID=1415166 RepID=W5TKE4_9NOCA|nr:carboxyl transferase domain-containing protein [Nocardia nova]AHH19835.1 acetyl-/propionyl-CoA carboxylase beta subunit [Nocardia nova SH22a]
MADHPGALKARRYLISDEARAAAVERQHGLGKATARERIAYLLDVGTFAEYGGFGLPVEETGPEATSLADGVVTGTGMVDGRPVSIVSFDYMVSGGSQAAIGDLKVEQAIETSLRHGIPLVLLMEGGGHRISEGLDSRDYAWGGHGFFQGFAALSGYAPMVTAILGPSFGGPTNFAALSDYVVAVRGTSSMGMGGPALVEAATGEKIDKETLGGADLQGSLGVVDYVAASEREALDSLRAVLGYLPSNCEQEPPRVRSDIRADPAAAKLDTLVPLDMSEAYDVVPAVRGIADAESVLEIKPTYAPNIVTALARIDGRPVGILANQPMHLSGALDSPACEKAAHFVAWCDAFGLPLIFLADVPGFLVGTGSTITQLPRRSGRLLYELGIATVPRISVVMRKGYGGGYVAMGGGRSFDPDLAVAWPTAEVCAMSIEGAIDVAYRRDYTAAEDPQARRRELIAEVRDRVGALRAAEGFGLDDVIEPSETRARIAHVLAIARRRTNARASRIRPISPI